MQSREQYYKNEYFIHDLVAADIIRILTSNPWSGVKQAISSAETNNDDRALPDMHSVAMGLNTAGVDAFADLEFENNVTCMLDVGGGKFDVCRDYMQTRGIELLVYDPFNRSQEHNKKIKLMVKAEKVAAATSMSVLNVIAEPEARLAHIALLNDALIIGGAAYFKVWPGEGNLMGSYRPTVYSYGHPGYQANACADRFLREVQLVFGIDHVKLHETIPNLIVAKKADAIHICQDKIEQIQALSRQDAWFINKTKVSLAGSAAFFAVADAKPTGDANPAPAISERSI